MKKTLLMISASLLTLALLNSCGKKEVDPGSVTLDPAQATITYDQTVKLKPEFSLSGEAKNKSYVWKSNADSIATVKAAITGGYGDVTAKRVGVATITYVSTDGLVSATATITVQARSNILNGLYYKKGVSFSDISVNVAGFYEYDSTNSTDKYKIYTITSQTISKLIYELDDSGKLATLWVVFVDNTSNRTSVEYYITERFPTTGKTQNGISFYKNTGFSDVLPINTVIGTFVDTTINETTYSFGVKIMDVSYLP